MKEQQLKLISASGDKYIIFKCSLEKGITVSTKDGMANNLDARDYANLHQAFVGETKATRHTVKLPGDCRLVFSGKVITVYSGFDEGFSLTDEDQRILRWVMPRWIDLIYSGKQN